MAQLDCTPYGLAAAALAALQQQLALTRGGTPNRMAVYPRAAPALEFCSMGWVGFRSVKPGQLIGRGQCGVASWSVELTLGVARCYPVMEQNAAPPVPSVDSAARDILDDFEAMRRAATALADIDGIMPTFGNWVPLVPQGGGHGSTLDVSVTAGLGLFTDAVVPMLPGDPRAES